MAVKIFHIADVHLDSPFSLQSVSQAERRRSELRSALSSAVMFAKENGIGIFLIAGDLFDSEYITSDGAAFIAGVIKSYPDCHFFLSPGNHDPFTSPSVYSTYRFPPNLHIFGAKSKVVLEDMGVCVYGCGFPSAVYTDSPVTGYGELDPGMINILVCHGDTSNPSSPSGPVTEAEMASSGFDYIALGHIHKPTGLLYAGGTAYCYPGCLVGRSYDEPGHHGGMYGLVGKGKTELKAVKFSVRRYETAFCDIAGCTKYEALDKIRAGISQYTNDTLLRLILTGETSDGFVISPDEIGSGDKFPMKTEIIDRTVPKPVLTEMESDVSIKGVFCRKMQEHLGDGDDMAAVTSLALKYGLSALADRSFLDITEDDDG